MAALAPLCYAVRTSELLAHYCTATRRLPECDAAALFEHHRANRAHPNASEWGCSGGVHVAHDIQASHPNLSRALAHTVQAVQDDTRWSFKRSAAMLKRHRLPTRCSAYHHQLIEHNGRRAMGNPLLALPSHPLRHQDYEPPEESKRPRCAKLPAEASRYEDEETQDAPQLADALASEAADIWTRPHCERRAQGVRESCAGTWRRSSGQKAWRLVRCARWCSSGTDRSTC